MKRVKKALVIIISLIFLFYVVVQEEYPEVYFFDIGQGDSSMIVLPGNTQILIDGGPNDSILDHLNTVMPFYDKKIEFVVLTHGDADHLAGLVEVINDYDVEVVFMPSWEHDSQLFHSWVRQLEEKQIEVSYITKNLITKIDEAEVHFLHPSINTSEQRSINDESVVMQVHINDISILYTGDISVDVEKRLLYTYEDQLESDILKVAHHGSKTSSHSEFLHAVNPKIAVIQAGKENKFSHPHQRVLYRLSDINATIFRTDLQKTVHFVLPRGQVSYDRGMQSFIHWLFGKNLENVYTSGS